MDIFERYREFGLPLETGLTRVRKAGNIESVFNHRAEITFDEGWRLINPNSTRMYREGEERLLDLHTHPVRDRSDAIDVEHEFIGDILAMIAKANIPHAGRVEVSDTDYLPEVIVQPFTDGTIETMVLRREGRNTYTLTRIDESGRMEAPKPISFNEDSVARTRERQVEKGVMAWTHSVTVDGRQYSAEVRAGRDGFEIAVGEEPEIDEFKQLVVDRVTNLVKTLAALGMAPLKALLSELDTSGRRFKLKEETTLQTVHGMALDLIEATRFQEHLGIGIDARQSAYSLERISADINEVARKNGPIHYILVVDRKEEASRAKISEGVIIVGVGEHEDVLKKVSDRLSEYHSSTGIKIKHSNISFALTETDENLEIISSNYNAARNESEDRFNFLIANKIEVGDKDGDIPAAALLNLLVKIASRNETTVMAIGCSRTTLDRLEDLGKSMLSGILRLIKIARLNIEQMVADTLNAFKTTGRSL